MDLIGQGASAFHTLTSETLRPLLSLKCGPTSLLVFLTLARLASVEANSVELPRCGAFLRLISSAAN